MSNINKNLKQIRMLKQMTQEEVANQIGLTRQAISSYEAGRTQPGVDILMKLAEVYGVDLEAILYGTDKYQQDKKKLQRIGILFSIVWLVLLTIRGFLRIIAVTIYMLEEGAVAEEMVPILDKHFQLLNFANKIDSISMQFLLVACIILLVLDIKNHSFINYKTKIKYICLFIVLTLAYNAFLAYLDPFYHILEYTYLFLGRGIPILLLFLLVDFIVQYSQTKRM